MGKKATDQTTSDKVTLKIESALIEEVRQLKNAMEQALKEITGEAQKLRPAAEPKYPAEFINKLSKLAKLSDDVEEAVKDVIEYANLDTFELLY
jgi:hypothetical protein